MKHTVKNGFHTNPVKINLVDDEAVFPIPPFRYYTLLVIREMKKR